MNTYSATNAGRSDPSRNGDRRDHRLTRILAAAVGLTLVVFVLSTVVDQRALNPTGFDAAVSPDPSTTGDRASGDGDTSNSDGDSAGDSASVDGSASADGSAPTGEQLEAPDPTGVRVPSIGVDAPTIPLGLRSDGAIEVPEDYDETGWWKDGPEPGEIGPAVILGHVDSYEGPAVFYELDGLSVGDPIHIDRADGSTVTYLVERIEQHPKDDFPTAAVYGPTDESELRLVTCGGTFDREARSYRDNVIVFAVAQA